MATKRKPAAKRKPTAKAKQTARQQSAERKRQRGRTRDLRQEKTSQRKARRGGRKHTSFRETVAWRLTRGTVKGTVKGVGKYTPIIVKSAKSKIDREREKQKFEEGYEPEDGEIPPLKFSLKSTFTCCERRFKTPEALNRHHERVHDGEVPDLKPRERPTLIVSNTTRSSGKRTVKPVPNTPTGRHRGRPGSTPAEALIAAHRQKFTEIGVKAVSTDDSASHMIKRGFTQLVDQPLGGLRQMETDMLGLEQAFAVGMESMRYYRLKMINAGFKAEDLQNLVRMEEQCEELSTRAASHIAHLKAELAPAIAEARARAKGIVVSDEVLTS